MRRDNTKGKIQRTILHHLSWRGMAASLAMAALPAAAAEPDSLAIDTMSYDLGDVTVTAQRKLVKNDIDKLTYDVANDETARTKNTLDMLRSVPLVTIDGQENISIKGSPSFKVYRNGHPDLTLSSQNLKDVLKSIPASQIKKVEVITDPGAKEDAEGTQYILNLVMQNNFHLAGVTGTVSANYNPLRQGPGMGTMLTIQKGKLATSINYGYQHDKKDQGNDATRQYLKTDQTMESRSRNTTMTNVHYGNISASYEVDSLNLLTLNFGGYYYNAGIGGVNGYERMTNGNGPSSRPTTPSTSEDDWTTNTRPTRRERCSPHPISCRPPAPTRTRPRNIWTSSTCPSATQATKTTAARSLTSIPSSSTTYAR